MLEPIRRFLRTVDGDAARVAGYTVARSTDGDRRERWLPMHDDTQRFTIVHTPLNPYSAAAFGLVFKLSYPSRGRDKPTLEIFRDDEEARSKEWYVAR